MNQITYTATYKRPYLFGKKVVLKDCIGDGVEPSLGFRFFDMLSGSKVYIDIKSEVTFSKDRNICIEKRLLEQVK